MSVVLNDNRLTDPSQAKSTCNPTRPARRFVHLSVCQRVGYLVAALWAAAARYFPNGSDIGWPGIKRLSEDMGVSKRTVERRLRKAEEAGIIQRDRGKPRQRWAWTLLYGHGHTYTAGNGLFAKGNRLEILDSVWDSMTTVEAFVWSYIDSLDRDSDNPRWSCRIFRRTIAQKLGIGSRHTLEKTLRSLREKGHLVWREDREARQFITIGPWHERKPLIAAQTPPKRDEQDSTRHFCRSGENTLLNRIEKAQICRSDPTLLPVRPDTFATSTDQLFVPETSTTPRCTDGKSTEVQETGHERDQSATADGDRKVANEKQQPDSSIATDDLDVPIPDPGPPPDFDSKPSVPDRVIRAARETGKTRQVRQAVHQMCNAAGCVSFGFWMLRELDTAIGEIEANGDTVRHPDKLLRKKGRQNWREYQRLKRSAMHGLRNHLEDFTRYCGLDNDTIDRFRNDCWQDLERLVSEQAGQGDGAMFFTPGVQLLDDRWAIPRGPVARLLYAWGREQDRDIPREMVDSVREREKAKRRRAAEARRKAEREEAERRRKQAKREEEVRNLQQKDVADLNEDEALRYFQWAKLNDRPDIMQQIKANSPVFAAA